MTRTVLVLVLIVLGATGCLNTIPVSTANRAVVDGPGVIYLDDSARVVIQHSTVTVYLRPDQTVDVDTAATLPLTTIP